MSLRVNTNVPARIVWGQLTSKTGDVEKAIKHLSSGLRIMGAQDDVGALGMSERMRAQIRGLDMANSNSQDGWNLLGTAEGALGETHAILQRMRELAVQAATDTLTLSDRASVKQEMDQLSSEISRIGDNTEFNTHRLLDGGTFGQLFTLQVGANAGDFATFSINDMRSVAIGVASTQLSVSDPGLASAAIAAIDQAIQQVSDQRDYLGAKMNMLEHHMSVLGVMSTNQQASESRIRDLDFAKAASQLTRTQLLQQSAIAMMAQANQTPNAVLSLLR